MSLIECVNLTKEYKDTLALNNFNCKIEENKIIGLIGRNGAGKTSLLKICAGYIRPTSGEINIFGEKVFDNLNVLGNMIFIDEEIQYDNNLRLIDIMTLGKAYYKNWDDNFAKKMLQFFGLNEKKKYKKLSRGMKTQFNIIMGISSRMPLTLFDEPTLGLDAAFRKEFYNILLKDYMNHPRTIIISSHLLNEIENLLEEIVLINEGELVLHESIETIQNYAVILNGKKDVIEEFIKNKEVLSSDQLGNNLIVGIKNDLSKEDIAYLKKKNVDVSKMSAQDVCINLTGKGKEGVFDGFES